MGEVVVEVYKNQQIPHIGTVNLNYKNINCKIFIFDVLGITCAILYVVRGTALAQETDAHV